jgi:hypothetical protein
VTKPQADESSLSICNPEYTEAGDTGLLREKENSSADADLTFEY